MTNTNWIDELAERLGTWRPEHVPWSPPQDEDLRELEAQLGASLPEEYRYFLRRYGEVSLGNDDAYPEAPIAEQCPWGDSVRPECFYPLLRGHPDDLREQLLTYRGRIPHGVLPIAPDAGGNQVCLDVAGAFPGSVWFWDHEQRWFTGSLEEAARELEARGANGRRLSAQDIIRGWTRLHADQFDRPPDYMGMYRMAPTFADFLRCLKRVAY